MMEASWEPAPLLTRQTYSPESATETWASRSREPETCGESVEAQSEDSPGKESSPRDTRAVDVTPRPWLLRLGGHEEPDRGALPCSGPGKRRCWEWEKEGWTARPLPGVLPGGSHRACTT